MLKSIISARAAVLMLALMLAPAGQSGAQTVELNHKQLASLIASAKTPPITKELRRITAKKRSG